MAGGGVGEAMLIGAAVGAGTGGVMSAVQDKDPLEGALLGAAMGAAGGGIGSGIGGLASGASSGAGAGAATGTAGGAAGGAGGALPAGMTSTTAGAFGSGAPLGSSVVPSAFTPAGSGLVGGTSAGVPTVASGAAGMTGGATGGVGGGAGGAAAGSAPASWASQGLGQGFAPALTNAQAYGAGAGGGIMGLIGNAQNQGEQWAPEAEPYSGSLSYFKYNPQTFRPSVAPGYADGGITDLDVGSRQAMMRGSIDPVAMMARGGMSNLGSYSDGGRMLKGPGDGMSDDIPGVIAGKQPARLADGEFVVPADVVSHLGNGSTDAGAKKLYSMMDNVRKARTGSKKQGKQIKAEKHLPGMKSGGVARYDEGGQTGEEAPPWFTNWLATQEQQPRPGMGNVAQNFQPSGFTGTDHQYSPYTMSGRPSSSEPQYYQDIYRGYTPDFSTPGYTLAGNLGEWSNVAGENQRALQPASKNQQITQAYLQELGRAPDQQGFNYWMESELPSSEIRRYISGSPEQQGLGWSPEERATINQMYQDYLGRDVEGGGLQYWEQRLGDQLNQDQVRDYIMNSPEAQQYEQNFLTNAYNQYLGRAPDEAGLQWWQQQQVGTTNQQDILDLIRNSPEAQAYAASQQVQAAPQSAPQPAPQQAQAAPQPEPVENKRRGGIASLMR